MRLLSFLVAIGIFGLDLSTKWYVKNSAALHYHPVIDGLFTLRYVRNEGIAFGLFHTLDSPWKPIVLSALGVMAIAVVFYSLWTTPRHHTRLFWSFGFLLGGILGNFTDRLVHGFVVDFIELHWRSLFYWPTFNVADAAITLGVFAILWESFFGSALKEP